MPASSRAALPTAPPLATATVSVSSKVPLLFAFEVLLFLTYMFYVLVLSKLWLLTQCRSFRCSYWIAIVSESHCAAGSFADVALFCFLFLDVIYFVANAMWRPHDDFPVFEIED